MEIHPIVDETFYTGFEGEPEVDFIYDGKCLKVWDGYIYSLMQQAPLDGHGWHGMTRDYHEFQGPWDEDEADVDATEYLNDLKQYELYNFEDPAVKQMLKKLENLFVQAAKKHEKVHIVVA